MKHIYLIGDVHGDFRPIRNFSQRHIKLHKDAAAGDENILICLGDFGANFFFNHRDEKLKEKLGKYNFTYFVIRGNHEQRPSFCEAENPELWHREVYFDNVVYVENKYPYIKYAYDKPAVYNINGYQTLVLPGAYSVDKYVRLQNGWSWFEQELPTEEEMNDGIKICEEKNNKFDLILSHTCPIMFEPTDLFLSCVDQSMVDKTMERYLGQIEYTVDYKTWLWGHYHAFRDYPRTDRRKRIMLSAGEEVVELEQIMNNDTIERI